MSRYDDLWSVYYISVENMVGQLPWRHVEGKAEESSPPASLVVLYRHLRRSSFYCEPEYENFVKEINLDLNQRHFKEGYSLLDWQADLLMVSGSKNDTKYIRVQHNHIRMSPSGLAAGKTSEKGGETNGYQSYDNFGARNHRHLVEPCHCNKDKANAKRNDANNRLTENDDRSYYFIRPFIKS
ncbi:unnamed protein product [Gongylonema pulchrum]|uniref:Uncharacterized protein n=1 Tax=Gongylonema pulchrum TaxID=637853 RepID=A0A183D4T4_9BILA|nr:unnamed protein product [Gongylonema pulchrum]